MRVALLALLVGCETAPEAPASTPDAGARTAPSEVAPPDAAAGTLALGEQVFAARCSPCHGPEGRGDGPAAVGLDPKPVDLHGPRPAHLRGTPGGRLAVIANGSPGSAMPPWKGVLSAEELDAVYAVVHRMRHGDAPQSGPGAGGPP